MSNQRYTIHQTWGNDVPDRHREYVESVKRCNPNAEYVLWTDTDIDRYVKDKTPQFYEAYRKFATHIERVDFARYVILYFYPGVSVYADVDILALKSLQPLVNRNEIILGYECSEHNVLYSGGICNALMISPTNQIFWMDFMRFIVERYHIHWYEKAVHRTGPVALKRFYESAWDRDKYQLHILSNYLRE